MLLRRDDTTTNNVELHAPLANKSGRHGRKNFLSACLSCRIVPGSRSVSRTDTIGSNCNLESIQLRICGVFADKRSELLLGRSFPNIAPSIRPLCEQNVLKPPLGVEGYHEAGSYGRPSSRRYSQVLSNATGTGEAEADSVRHRG